MDNRQSALSQTSYARLRDAIATSSEAFFAARAARRRVRAVKPGVPNEQSLGRLALSLDASGVRMFATWPALPPALFDEARAIARSAAHRCLPAAAPPRCCVLSDTSGVRRP
jgi:hypothetical protein